MARPSKYSAAKADAICDRLINGESLRAICEDAEMPDRSTVLRWMNADDDFAAKCAHARLLQADLMDDMILETAQACTPETAIADRVKISAYQWRASKLAPKRYGEKTTTELTGADGGPVEFSWATSPSEARKDPSSAS